MLQIPPADITYYLARFNIAAIFVVAVFGAD